MKFIHTFWSKPLHKNKFNKFNASLEVILQNYAYSFTCAKRLGKDIVLYADEFGAELLSFIPYDDVKIVNGLDNESIHFAAQIKFAALKDCELGDAIIDGDLFIRKQTALDVIDDSSPDILYSFFEPYMFTLQDDSIHKYYNSAFKIFNKYEFEYPYVPAMHFSELEWMNTSLIKINNQKLKDEYIEQYYKHKAMLDNEEYDNFWPDIFIEQMFLTQLCSVKNYKAKPVIEHFYFDARANEKALELGFTHLGSDKQVHLPWVDQLFLDEAPDLFYKYREQFEKYKQKGS